MNVRVNLNYPIYDGAEIVFKAPCDASKVTGLIVYYPGDTGIVSSVFTFADAHTNDLGHIDELFAAGAVVKVILDTDTGMAFVQNAATNAYLEKRFKDLNKGSGNGNSTDSDLLQITIAYEGEKYVCSHTAESIRDAIDSGKMVVYSYDDEFSHHSYGFVWHYYVYDDGSGTEVERLYAGEFTYDFWARKWERTAFFPSEYGNVEQIVTTNYSNIKKLTSSIGNISTALDRIIALQEELIGI